MFSLINPAVRLPLHSFDSFTCLKIIAFESQVKGGGTPICWVYGWISEKRHDPVFGPLKSNKGYRILFLGTSVPLRLYVLGHYNISFIK